MKAIDFGLLLPLVLELDELRFKGTPLTEVEVTQLRRLQEHFALLTNQRLLPPRRFSTDACSLSPDAFGVQYCVLHDLAYWLGGTRAERLAADRRLREGTRKKNRVYAEIQYLGVRFGVPFAPDFILNKRFRWGFGWEYPAPGEPGTVY
jgi:hypothetical protein